MFNLKGFIYKEEDFNALLIFFFSFSCGLCKVWVVKLYRGEKKENRENLMRSNGVKSTLCSPIFLEHLFVLSSLPLQHPPPDTVKQ